MTDNSNIIKLEEEAAKIVQEEYGTAALFILAYSSNNRKVEQKIIGKMKVVPISIKQLLGRFFKDLITEKPDEYA
uniref:Uncharacterized protein n=1 Tax=viral metagenome TaxID=1070528 RepID=A0A6H2A411_9ZZZZ